MTNQIRRIGISDLLFKKIFADQNDKSLLTDYVNAICNLNLKPEHVEFLPIELKDTEDERGIRLDVRFQEISGEKYTQTNLEAQTTLPKERTFDNRKFLYAASLFKDGFSKGDDYDKEVYSRTIFFILRKPNLEGSPIKKTVMYELNDKKIHDQIEIYEIYIENLMNRPIEELSNYDKIILEITSVLVEENYNKYKDSRNPIVKKVVDKMIHMTAEEGKRISEELSRQYHQEMAALNQMYIDQGIEQGIEQGIKQGKSEKTIQFAIKLKSKGYTLEQIADLLEITIEETKELLK